MHTTHRLVILVLKYDQENISFTRGSLETNWNEYGQFYVLFSGKNFMMKIRDF